MPDFAALTAADFDAVLGTSFEIVDIEADPVAIRLAEVTVLGERPGYRQPFSLRFRGPLSPTLAQVTHRVAHAEMGRFDLFLGPVAADSDGITYEAVFA
ncbi:MAG TPA: hypothetical protein VG295_07555 [Solirubrobacteraceae bacterium]|jgi:hypothetical protein|nr:hypothetical protein [Solirubrobacteraceae bacterium]